MIYRLWLFLQRISVVLHYSCGEWDCLKKTNICILEPVRRLQCEKCHRSQVIFNHKNFFGLFIDLLSLGHNVNRLICRFQTAACINSLTCLPRQIRAGVGANKNPWQKSQWAQVSLMYTPSLMLAFQFSWPAFMTAGLGFPPIIWCNHPYLGHVSPSHPPKFLYSLPIDVL